MPSMLARQAQLPSTAETWASAGAAANAAIRAADRGTEWPLPYLAGRGVKLTGSNYQSADGAIKRVRWVCHLDISSADIEQTLQAVAEFAEQSQ